MIDVPRSTTRAEWRCAWRRSRIIGRETWLASEDMILFGTSYILTGERAHHGYQWIPLEKIEHQRRHDLERQQW